ncbi:MAG: hypothetical protein HQL11_00800 [Candidatus Omnitrophica bacterium]|nr:hypothetical protein [Candidatus Omnitrophota bacterium]
MARICHSHAGGECDYDEKITTQASHVTPYDAGEVFLTSPSHSRARILKDRAGWKKRMVSYVLSAEGDARLCEVRDLEEELKKARTRLEEIYFRSLKN